MQWLKIFEYIIIPNNNPELREETKLVDTGLAMAISILSV